MVGPSDGWCCCLHSQGLVGPFWVFNNPKDWLLIARGLPASERLLWLYLCIFYRGVGGSDVYLSVDRERV